MKKLLENDEVFLTMCEFHEELKEMCEKLNLKTAQEVKHYLRTTPKNNKDRMNLCIELSGVKFAETIMSGFYLKGLKAIKVGVGEDVYISADLMLQMFNNKINKIKRYLTKKGIDFDTLSFEEQLKQFKKTLLLENENVRNGCIDLFVKKYYNVDYDLNNLDIQNNILT